MIHNPRSAQFVRILALLLCVSIVVFFSALLIHSHGAGATADHSAHCQVCALGHTAAFTATIISLSVALQMLMLMQAGTPRRGSPCFVAMPTTRPPPCTL